MSVDDYDKVMLSRKDDTNESGAASSNTIAELVDITQTDRRGGDKPKITLTQRLHLETYSQHEYDHYALVLRRCFDVNGEKSHTVLEIQSPLIRQALKGIIQDYPTVNLQANPILIPQPYAALFHFRKQIRDYASSMERTAEEKTQLALLTDFMHNNLKEAEAEYDQFLPEWKISWKFLWTLYCPEDLVVVENSYFQECCRVVDHAEVKTDDGRALKIKVWHWDTNGTSSGAALREYLIYAYAGAQNVAQVGGISPFRFLRPDQQQIVRDRCIVRGRLWERLLKTTHLEYNNIAWMHPPSKHYINDIEQLVPTHVIGRVIIDSKSHVRKHYGIAPKFFRNQNMQTPECLADVIRSTQRSQKLQETRVVPNDSTSQLNDELLMLCPARVRGYSLEQKLFVLLLVEELHPVHWKREDFDQLQIESEFKSVIRALVQNHYQTNGVHQHFINRKGSGLIILLHGPPGCGKTLTAEAASELTQRPLLRISSAELGIDSNEAEIHLQSCLDLAKSWGAIVLLDEADVFLAQRHENDITRNAFVAVFLRVLEYFEGIMFLTTNRVEDFDDAFQSRIVLTIKYPALGERQRAAIWASALESAKKKGHVPGLDQNNIKQLAEELGKELEVNGREIKNLVKLGIALAEDSKTPFTKEKVSMFHKINQRSRP